MTMEQQEHGSIIGARARDLAASVRTGEHSAREVVAAHLDRIAEVNPAVNALLDVQPETALAQAAAIDAMPPEVRAALPLAGLPVAVKDLIPARGFRYTQGSPIFSERVATTDHVVVERMRAAGAVIVGKSNTPEFGLGSHTFNPVTGVTRNPYDLDKTAGGSSGGAAAALASGMLPIADGSDTGGSLRNPASFCNVVGMRPSLGAVPNHPGGYGFGTLSVKGPMARCVADVRLLFDVIAGRHPLDPLSADTLPGPKGAGPAAAWSPDGGMGIRAAWTPDFGGEVSVSAEVLSVLSPAIDRLAVAGFRMESGHPDLGGAREAFRTLRGLQMFNNLAPLASDHAHQMKEYAVWTDPVRPAGTGAQDPEAMATQSRVFQRMAEFLGDVDMLLTPTCQVAPFDVHERYPRSIDGRVLDDYLEWMTLPSIITLTGHPAVSIPAGFTASGLPVGLQVVGRYRDDRTLLAMAQVVEAAVGSGHIAPQADLSTARDRFPTIH